MSPLSPGFPFDSKTFSDGSRLALHFNLIHNMYHGYTGTILPVVKGTGTFGKRSILVYISQKFIMACFIAFERNQFYQILKIASISPKRLTYTIRSFSLSLCLVFSLILSFADCSDI